jgi:hypothetical protein
MTLRDVELFFFSMIIITLENTVGASSVSRFSDVARHLGRHLNYPLNYTLNYPLNYALNYNK